MSATAGTTTPGLSRDELAVALVAMAVQLVGIVDLVILGPLGPAMVAEYGRDLAWFASTVLAFTVASAVANVAGANVVDRFDRKSALLVLFGGFGVAQAACFVAPTPALFLAARVFGGACAGLFSSTVSALVGDTVAPERRGRANGVVSVAYALAFIVGVPAGLLLAESGSWRAPFAAMAGLCLAVVLVAAWALKPARGHLARPSTRAALPAVLADGGRRRALFVNAALMFSAYAVTPFLADAVVDDLGYTTADLPGFYLVGGVVTLGAAIGTGVWADRRGVRSALRLTVAASLPGTLWAGVMTDLGWWPTALAVVAFMAPVTARTVPANTLAMGAVPEELRGAMMSLSSASSQLGLGLGAMAAGWLVMADTPLLTGFGWCGVLSAAVAVVAALVA